MRLISALVLVVREGTAQAGSIDSEFDTPARSSPPQSSQG